MGELVLDSSGSSGIPNALSVDSGGHVPIVHRPAAFGQRGIYRATLTSLGISGGGGAGVIIWSLGPVYPASPARLVLVNSIKVSAVITSVITTAALMDFGLFVFRNGGLITTVGSGGTLFSPMPAQQQQLRSSMGGSTSTIAICGTPTNNAGSTDTNPIARVMGFSGTAVGTQVFSPTTVTLYQRDQPDNYPIILTNTGGNSCDRLAITTANAGPATGVFTITVAVEWEETVAF